MELFVYGLLALTSIVGLTFIVERGIASTFATHGLDPRCVRTLATIDKKADEEAFLQLSQKYDWPVIIYAAEQLDAAPGIENPSATVLKHVGTRGVAEPSRKNT